jgi:MinD superfamily P-loop ATPase
MTEIAVISGKGGTGKSSITAAFAAIEKNLILADCDVDAANQFLLFNPDNEEEAVYIAGHKAVIDQNKCNRCGLCMSYCRFGAITENKGIYDISSINCDGCFLCQRVCPQNAIKMVVNDKSRMYSGSFRYGKIVYGRLAPGEENSGKLVNLVREKARKMAEAGYSDLILIDGPPGTGCPVISSITGVDKIIIVTEPTYSGLADLLRVCEIIKNPANAYVIINKSDLNPEITESIKGWCSVKNIKVAGTIPFDTSVTEAMVQSKTINEFFESSLVSTSIKEIWTTQIRKSPDQQN